MRTIFWGKRKVSVTETAHRKCEEFLKGEMSIQFQRNKRIFIGLWREGCCKVRVTIY